MKEFRLNKLEYACTLNDVIHISTANKSDKYFLDEELTIPLVFCSGDRNVDYWRTEPNIDESIIRTYVGSSESIEHINAKRSFYRGLRLDFHKDSILGYSAVMEYYVKEINKTIDVVYLDESGKVIVGIEIFCTNKKTEDDIKKFNKVKFPIYEYDNNTTAIYPISAGDTDTSEITKLLNRIDKDKQDINKVHSRIRKSKEVILEIEKGIELEGRRYYIIKEENGDPSDELVISLRHQIKECNEERRRYLAEIKYFNEGGCESLREEISNFEEARRGRLESINNEINNFKETEEREAESLRVQIDRLEAGSKDLSRIRKSLSALSSRYSEHLGIKSKNEKISREIESIERDIANETYREQFIRREIKNNL